MSIYRPHTPDKDMLSQLRTLELNIVHAPRVCAVQSSSLEKNRTVTECDKKIKLRLIL